jgi:NADPH-dependent glutamate synthase beta subunit-like oxidoreductase
MMKLGIPEYRLDRDLLQVELDAIVDLGVEVHLNTRLGDDVTFSELQARHDAMFVAIGASLGRGLDIEGHDADGVLRAIEFLININQGYKVDIGERVIVIGGGDVAMDAARTALRSADYDRNLAERGLESANVAATTAAIDAARTAARFGAKEVTVISLESEAELPASPFELIEAREENIEFIHRRGPGRILTQDGRVSGIETIGVISVFDADGRFAPEFNTDDVRILDADTVILAVGQAVDVEALGEDGPEVSERRTVAVTDGTLKTSLRDVWAGGDAVHGPRSLIEAIADGRRVAEEIHVRFGGRADERPDGRLVELDQFHRIEDTYDRVPRVTVPTLETGRRTGLAEVETGFTEEQARLEASRCLRCFSNIQLDTDLCVLCALCVDVCPTDVLSIAPMIDFDPSAVGTALLLDETRCIRCALCVARCPTKALSMESWVGAGSLPAPELAESGVG